MRRRGGELVAALNRLVADGGALLVDGQKIGDPHPLPQRLALGAQGLDGVEVWAKLEIGALIEGRAKPSRNRLRRA